jgi:hypothetical protein
MTDKIIFKDCCIQKGHRVKIPKAIVDTLNLKEGKKIILEFNPVKEEIVIREEKR